MPRPLLVTGEVQHRYCALLAVGCTRRQAAALVGLNESTIRTAMRRDERFAAEVLRSEQTRETLPLAKLQTAGQRSWRAHVWFLQHLDRQEYGPRPTREPFNPFDGGDDLDLPPNDDRPAHPTSSPMQSDLPDREGP